MSFRETYEQFKKLFVDEMKKHFELIHEDVYFANPALYNNEIEAILPWFATGMSNDFFQPF